MKVLRYGGAYFLLVFSAGFLLGMLRVPFLEPVLGVRWAELVEMPFMLLAIWWAAGAVIGPARLSSTPSALAAGVLALSLLLLVEFTVVLSLRGGTLATWWADRDPVSGSAYLASLVFYALAPAWRWHRFLPGGGHA